MESTPVNNKRYHIQRTSSRYVVWCTDCGWKISGHFNNEEQEKEIALAWREHESFVHGATIHQLELFQEANQCLR